jgi:TolA-binding protein
MRSSLIAALLLVGTAAPALAQRAETVEQRVQRLEQQLRAVQRRVFPDGRAQFVEPEISAETRAPASPAPASDALSNLSSRVDALEAQLRSLTGQVEEQGYRTRQLEQQIGQLRTDLQARLDRLEPAPRESSEPPASAPSESDETSTAPDEAPDEPPAAPAASAGSAEDAYNAGFRLWNSQRYAEAQQSLEAAAARFPSTRWTSWMRNLQGRAYLDDDKPATAARIFLANYQDNPQGERAADSLFYLGQALSRLNRRAEACRVYGELEQVYPNMRASLRAGLPRARADARCAETSADRR